MRTWRGNLKPWQWEMPSATGSGLYADWGRGLQIKGKDNFKTNGWWGFKVRGYNIKVSPDKKKRNSAAADCATEHNIPPPLPPSHPWAVSSDYSAAHPKSTPQSRLVLPWVGVGTQGVKVAHEARWCCGAKSLIWGTKERSKGLAEVCLMGLLSQLWQPRQRLHV